MLLLNRSTLSIGTQKQPAMKSLTRTQLAREMGISRTTLWRRLKSKNHELQRTLITPEEKVEIFELLGWKVEQPVKMAVDETT